MTSSSSRTPLLAGLLLVLLMAATRSHHVADLTHLPDASWAVFFLAGFYLPTLAFGGLLALAALVDYVAITWGGVSSFCVSPAYGFLLPAYGALWLAGRRFADAYCLSWQALKPLLTNLLLGAILCELISSGSFYFFSGRYAEPSLSVFATRVLHYFPASLQALLLYVGAAALIHLLVTSLQLRQMRRQLPGQHG
jgi:hypothetical protein